MSVAVEAAIILPVLLLIVGLLVVLAGQALASMAVSSAAAQGARAASIERDTGAAVTAARQVVAVSLAESGVQCRSSHVGVDAGGLRSPVGVAAHVTVTVRCQVEFGVGLPGFPQSQTLTASKSSPVDTYRSR